MSTHAPSPVATRQAKPSNGSHTRKAAPAGPRPSRVGDATIEDLAKIFKMLSDTSRLKILLALAQHGEMNVTELRALVGQSQPAVSHHLSLMRYARLVDCKRDGKKNFYRLDSVGLALVLEQVFGDMSNGSKQVQFEQFALAFKRRANPQG